MQTSLDIVLWRSCRFFFSSTSGQLKRSKSISTQSKEIGNLLVAAHITKTLSRSGTENLDVDSVSLSGSLIQHVLRKTSLDPSKKIEFFKWCSDRYGYKHSTEAYSQIFRVLCHSRSRQHLNDHVVRYLFSAMKHDGVLVDSATFKLLLDAFIHSGQIDSALATLEQMEALGATFSPLMYNSVVIALVREKQLGLALTMFTRLLEMSSGSGAAVPCEPVACNELLVSLRRAEMKEEFGKVFSCLREKNIALDAWGYNICIHSFGCWGDLETSLRLFREMKEPNAGTCCAPDLCTYNSLIHVLCLVGKVKDALIVWEELKHSGHEPDAFTYRILIQGCSKSYQVEVASKIFNEMLCSGFQPDTVVYNSLLDAFLKARKLTEACQLFEKMTQEGVRATCWTYNILIDGLIKNDRAVAGYTLFYDLKKKGQLVDGITYSIIIMHLCREGQIDEALHLVEEMEGRGFVVDLVTITSLLIGFYKQGRWNSTDQLMRHIRDGNLLHNVLRWKVNMEATLKHQQKKKEDCTPIFPAEGNFSEIVDLLSVGGGADSGVGSGDDEYSDWESGTADVDEWSSSPYMDQLANEVKSNGQFFKWFSLNKGRRVQAKGMNSFDIDMVNTYLSIFLAKGQLSIACKLFEVFTDMGIDAVNYTYNSIMSSFVKKGYFDQTWGILHEMGENLCPSDVATYNIIIQSLGKMGRADLASSILDKLVSEGGYLDIVMYNTLMNVLGKAGRVDEALKLFEQMRKSGINPDIVTFNTLIEIHTKVGRLKDAHKLLRMMLDAGCLPNDVTDTILDKLGKEMKKAPTKGND
ncbi:pentatricopeptide repeat-containing protein At4g01570-like [Chenopodium quinoa]|uniref:pentatricopeptide repeat-containing protein At4g01570-like n=1 Tax=Chenopodium quinoa TaxID=63459 RepID=UPI000B78F24A|nr:pentatricopeptide repeat-containing protein At4g01570-like [Chenopodium quinoa]